MEEVIVLSSDNEDSSSSPSSPSSASDMEIDPIEIEHNTTEQFVPKDNQTLQKIDLKTVTSLSAFLDPMTDFGHWENMKYNNYRKARVHATINQIYGNPIEQRNYRDLKARVNLKSVKRNSNTSVLSGVASLIDPCELASGDFRAGAYLACFNKEQHCRLITETLLSIIIRLLPLHLMPTTGYSGHRDWKFHTIRESVFSYHVVKLSPSFHDHSVLRLCIYLMIAIDWLDYNVRLGASVRSQAAHVIDHYWAG
uniref:Uncharacterized protein n=1 Tax=Glossina palpalis gambiensis TaxID=67801 RepID=A0A1B0BR89_9MUSC